MGIKDSKGLVGALVSILFLLVHFVSDFGGADVMGAQHHACEATTQLPAAAKLLHDRSTQRLFVLDAERRPLGVLTRGDVVRALAAAG